MEEPTDPPDFEFDKNSPLRDGKVSRLPPWWVFCLIIMTVLAGILYAGFILPDRKAKKWHEDQIKGQPINVITAP